MIDEPSIYLMPYTDDKLELVKGWDGLISPTGEFYKVCQRGNLEAAHDIFAEYYVQMKLKKNIFKEYEEFQQVNPRFKGLGLSAKDILINLFGFVNYEAMAKGVEITPPNIDYKNCKVTNQQLTTLARLAKINNDNTNAIFQALSSVYAVNENIEPKK